MEDDDSDFARRRLGEVLGGRWTLTRLLGTGGMAAVYAATGPGGAEAAVKVLHPEMSRRRDVRERFVLEAQVTERIAHPGVVRLLEPPIGDEQGAFLVMELLQGEPLGQRLRRVGTPAPTEAIAWLEQILATLAAAHAAGVIHRDLKPDNLFLTDQGAVKVLDFGVARTLEDTPGRARTRTGLAVGTLPYMAPEQALGKRELVDARSDLFSLGATFFRLLSGRRVHEADSEAELLFAMARDPAPPLARVAPHLPAALCLVIDRALAFERADRYPDAATMLADVQALRRGELPGHAVAVAGPASAPTVADAEAPTRVTGELVARAPAMPVAAPAAPPAAEAAVEAVSGPASSEATQLSARTRPLQHTVPLAAMPARPDGRFTTVRIEPAPGTGPSSDAAASGAPASAMAASAMAAPAAPPSAMAPSNVGALAPPPPVSVQPPRIIRGAPAAPTPAPPAAAGSRRALLLLAGVLATLVAGAAALAWRWSASDGAAPAPSASAPRRTITPAATRPTPPARTSAPPGPGRGNAQ